MLLTTVGLLPPLAVTTTFSLAAVVEVVNCGPRWLERAWITEHAVVDPRETGAAVDLQRGSPGAGVADSQRAAAVEGDVTDARNVLLRGLVQLEHAAVERDVAAGAARDKTERRSGGRPRALRRAFQAAVEIDGGVAAVVVRVAQIDPTIALGVGGIGERRADHNGGRARQYIISADREVAGVGDANATEEGGADAGAEAIDAVAVGTETCRSVTYHLGESAKEHRTVADGGHVQGSIVVSNLDPQGARGIALIMELIKLALNVPVSDKRPPLFTVTVWPEARLLLS